MASWELLKKVVSKSEKKIVKIYQKGNLTIQLVIIKPIKDNIFFIIGNLAESTLIHLSSAPSESG